MNITPQLRIDAVNFYLKSGESLRKTARRFNVHYQSLYQWVKLYRRGGKKNLIWRKIYNKRNNCSSGEINRKVMFLKENKPWLTVRDAKKILDKEGIKISLNGIWNIWKRFALAGVPHKKPSISFNIKIFPKTPEIRAGLSWTQELLNRNEIKKASEIVNDLPYCPDVEVLKKIPDRFLSLKRRVEKYPTLFGKISFNEYRNKTRHLRENLEREGLLYSAIRAGVEEALALQWMGKPENVITLINHLEQILGKGGEPSLRVSISLIKGNAFGMLFRIREAKRCMAKCNKKLLISFPFLYMDIASFYSSIGDIKKALFFAKKGLKAAPKESKVILYPQLSYFFSLAGRYRSSFRLLRKTGERSERIKLTSYLISAQNLLGVGKPQKASSLSQKVLSETRKEGLLSHFHAISLTLAGIYASLGYKRKAKNFIKRYVPILKKHKMRRDLAVRHALLGENISKNALLFPPIHLISLIRKALLSLKEKDYKAALNYASKNELLGVFHRFIFFFSDIIINLLEKGKETHLPKSILKLPVFNKEIPVYYIKILGNLIVYKNQKYLKVNLTPKDTAFLINFALKAGEPGKRISLKEIYRNFWRDSKNPSRNLSHLLVRIKKSINLPSYLLEFSYREDNPCLINRGIHFTTDYDEFKQTIAQAKALLRAGEWGFAKREFVRAFKLFRGEPFKKMYDNWSDDKRLEILFSYETEVKSFLRELVKRGRTKEAEKLLKKAEKIVPYSELRAQSDGK